VAYHYIPDHIENALRELYFQFRHKPVFKALITAIAAGVQEIEDEALNISQALILESATGAQLDLLGKIVGAARGGLSDRRYARIIQARIAANRSDGDAQTVYEVFETAAGSQNSEVEYTEAYDAFINLTLRTDEPLSTLEKRRVRRLVDLAKVGGVELRLVQGEIDALRFHARGSGKQTFDGPLFSDTF